MTWTTVEYTDRDSGLDKVDYYGHRDDEDDRPVLIAEEDDGFWVVPPGRRHEDRDPAHRFQTLTEATLFAEGL